MTYARILADVDSRAAHHPALDRAVAIARRTGAEVTVVDVVAGEYLAAHAEEELVDLMLQRLGAIAGEITGVSVQPKLLFGTPAAALIGEVERSGADLLVRSHARDLSSTRPKPYGPIDRELVRACPAPVLLAAPAVRPDRPRVVGAISPQDGQSEVAALNRVIIDYTVTMASIADGTSTVLQAWTPFYDGWLRTRGPSEGVVAYIEQRRREAIAGITDAIREADVDLEEVTLTARRGRVDDVLPDYIVRNGIDLVVVGVPPRRGFARLVRGTTAERLLRQLPCSVLAVKLGESATPVPQLTNAGSA